MSRFRLIYIKPTSIIDDIDITVSDQLYGPQINMPFDCLFNSLFRQKQNKENVEAWN